MRFKTDENIPNAIVKLLNQEGHDAVGALDQALGGHPDNEVAEVCQMEERIILTLDLDFADIRSFPPVRYSGIVILRPRFQAIRDLERLVQRVIESLKLRPIVGKLWIVDEHRIRVRE